MVGTMIAMMRSASIIVAPLSQTAFDQVTDEDGCGLVAAVGLLTDGLVHPERKADRIDLEGFLR